MNKKAFGIIGLGVMGKSLALNILDHMFSLSVYNRTGENEENVISDFIAENTTKNVVGFTKLPEFVASLSQPRKILIMVKAGEVVDAVINQLLPLLSENDSIIDGGNSHFKDTFRRLEFVKKQGIHFFGLGISGGEEGARKGPSLMPGGTKENYNEISEVLEAIAAKDVHGKPCCSYIGPEGAGHFVKMIHNGMEYADMQLLAEMYGLLSVTLSNEEIAAIFEEWDRGILSSYLLGITAKILKTKEQQTYVLDTILDRAGNKGTGSWSSAIALELGIPTSIKTAAVFARYTSSFKEQRTLLSTRVKNKNRACKPVDIEGLKEAYDFARTLNLQQGLQLLQQASNKYNWELNLSEICRVWTNGCIIKSAKIVRYVAKLKTITNLFEDSEVIAALEKQELSVQKIIEYGLVQRVQVPCFYESYNYWLAMTTAKSTANLIQAQRDYFGAHGFQRVDSTSEESFHFNWS